MIKRLKSSPVSQIASLSEARDFIGITRAADVSRDAVILDSIKAATAWAEKYCERAFLPQTWEIFTDTSINNVNLVRNLISVDLVSYYDVNNTLQSWTDYYVDLPSSKIIFNSMPGVYAREYPLIIEHTSGFSTVYDDLKRAILIIVSHWVKQGDNIEGNIITTVPYSARQILDFYRNYTEYFK